MTRRSFVTQVAPSAAATLAAGSGAFAQGPQSERQLYELRRYRIRVGAMRDATRAYLRDALLPALKRAGLGPVGAFEVSMGEPPTALVVIPHASADSAVTLQRRLASDAAYVKAADGFYNAPPERPTFERLETSLLLAFSGMPTMAATDPGKPRVFELRRYEGPSEGASLKKIEMFDTGGELTIFRKVGFRPVFFGQTLFGTRQPNFEYLLAYDDMADREAQWTRFRNDPDWKVLSAKDEYKDAAIMSGVTATLLSPLPFSQI